VAYTQTDPPGAAPDGERSLISTIALVRANVLQRRDSDDANVTERRIAIEASSSAAR